MIHTFKLYGTRVALDTGSGAAHLLDALDFDMLRYLVFPLENNTLSTLRYDLARYESADVSAAFAAFEKKNRDGVFSDGNDIDGTYVALPSSKKESDVTVDFSGNRPVFATEVIRAAEAGATVIDVACSDELVAENADIVDAELERIAKEIAKRRLGKVSEVPFEFVPFIIDTVKDDKGYLRVTDNSILELFRTQPTGGADLFRRKCAECALMLLLLE